MGIAKQIQASSQTKSAIAILELSIAICRVELSFPDH